MRHPSHDLAEATGVGVLVSQGRQVVGIYYTCRACGARGFAAAEGHRTQGAMMEPCRAETEQHKRKREKADAAG